MKLGSKKNEIGNSIQLIIYQNISIYYLTLLDHSLIELADLTTANAAHIVKSPDINIHTLHLR